MKYLCGIVALCLVAGVTVAAPSTTFTDSFDRPDGVVGNGWSTGTRPGVAAGSDVVIKNGKVTSLGVHGGAVYLSRDIGYGGPVTISATLTGGSIQGVPIEATFFFGGDGTYDSASVFLGFEGRSQVGTFVGLNYPNQYGTARVIAQLGVFNSSKIDITLDPTTGNITGLVEATNQTFSGHYDPSTVTPTSKFGIEFEPATVAPFAAPTIDDVSITYTDVSPATPIARPDSTPLSPSSGAKNLSLVIHGWNASTSPDDSPWVADMVDKICGRLGISTPGLQYFQCNTTDWDVQSLDWREPAGHNLSNPGSSVLVLPGIAWFQAQPVGVALAMRLEASGYEHVHLIAHSAGAEVAQIAIDTIVSDKQLNPKHCSGKNLAGTCSYPDIHVTFLDAYDPAGHQGTSTYGAGADWAEQYVDTRALGWNFLDLDTTDTYLGQSFNFDVTYLDRRGLNPAQIIPYDVRNLVFPNGGVLIDTTVQRHSFPGAYYRCTMLTPGANKSIPDVIGQPKVDCASIPAADLATFGFNLSREAGGNLTSNAAKFPLDSRYNSPHFCGFDSPLPSRGSFIPELNCVNGYSPTIFMSTSVIESPFFPILGNGASTSSTGTANTTPSVISGTALHSLLTVVKSGSPAWISLPFTSQDRLDAIQFDYQFTSHAEGLLTVSLDGELVFMADERFDGSQARSTAKLPAGGLAPGVHQLAIRVDPFTAQQSIVQVSNIQTYRTDATLPPSQPPVVFPPGDLNHDGVANCADLTVIKSSFGKRVGQVGFDSRADMNVDGVVNIIDLSTASRLLPAGTICK